MPKPGHKQFRAQGTRIPVTPGSSLVAHQTRIKNGLKKCTRDGSYTNGKNTIFVKSGGMIPPGYGRVRTQKYPVKK